MKPNFSFQQCALSCNQRNIKLFKYQSTICISIVDIRNALDLQKSFIFLSKLFLFYLRDALKAICLLIIPSDLDGFLIKFSINWDLNKVPKLSNYCIYKSTANGGHFWMHARHPIAMMICLEKWKTNVSQTNCTLSITMRKRCKITKI